MHIAVALFTEGVDWNQQIVIFILIIRFVALFTEGVDWNTYCWRGGSVNDVALFTEGVDWNTS